MDDKFRKQRALALWEEGQRLHLRGEVLRAHEFYNKSLKIFPTAEAYTFRGWAMSAYKRYSAAIADCRRAIKVDPNFGNAYNDLGTYLITVGKFDEGVKQLEKAKQARRYEHRHFPYMNLGRAFAEKGMLLRAIREFEGALMICPNEPSCVAALQTIRSMLH